MKAENWFQLRIVGVTPFLLNVGGSLLFNPLLGAAWRIGSTAMTNVSRRLGLLERFCYVTIVAYCYVSSFRLLLVILVPHSTDPHYWQSWYNNAAIDLGPAFLACSIVGWMSGWRNSLLHGVGMGAATVLGYALIHLIEQPATHADPVTLETGPWYFAGLTAFYLSGLLTGALLHAGWAHVTKSNNPTGAAR